MTNNKRRSDLLGKLTELNRLSEDVEATFRAGVEQSVQNRDIEGRLFTFISTVRADNEIPAQAWNAWESGINGRLDAMRVTKAQLSEMHLYTGTAQAVLTSSSTAAAYIHPVMLPKELAQQLQWLQQEHPASAQPQILEWQPEQPASAQPQIPASAQPQIQWTPEQAKTFEELLSGLKAAFAYKEWLPEVLALIDKLGADGTHPGQERASDHFRKARLAYDQPAGGVTSPVAVLVELRSGVNTLLERLRRRLVGQQPGGGIHNRVVNIGQHAGYQVFGSSHFDGLGRDLELVARDLNEAKGAQMTRGEVGEVLNKVLYTLRALLSGIDPTRLRSGQ